MTGRDGVRVREEKVISLGLNLSGVIRLYLKRPVQTRITAVGTTPITGTGTGTAAAAAAALPLRDIDIFIAHNPDILVYGLLGARKPLYFIG
jgi:hypothetical protein